MSSTISLQPTQNKFCSNINPNYRLGFNGSLMNIKGITDLLNALGYTAKYDGNFMLETSDLNNLNLCLNILNTDINQFNQKEYVKETSKLMMKNPEVAKEMEAKRRKLEEEKRQKERVKEMIEADKIERRERFKYK